MHSLRYSFAKQSDKVNFPEFNITEKKISKLSLN